MNRVFTMKDRRLIEALDYIDDEYIASAALYKMRSYAESTRPLAQTAGESLKKHWKHYLGFVACLLVLALVTPLFTHFPEIINSFAAGWGEGSGDETTEEVPYLQFSPDLEPISQELVDEINEEFFAYYGKYTKTLEEFYRENGENAEDRFNIIARVIRNYDLSSPYLGTIGDYVVFTAVMFTIMQQQEDEIAGYTFEHHTYVYCIETKTICHLKEAYEQGILNARHIKLLSKRRQEFIDYAKEHKDMPIRITEKEYYEYKNKGE